MLKAIHNNVVLSKCENTSPKGIFIPSTSNVTYIVLNVGNDVTTVNINQKVVLDKEPKKIQIELTDYYITSEQNIIAIVEDENE